MKNKYIILCSVASLLIWAVIFTFVLKRELSLGIYKDFFNLKITKAEHDAGARFFVLAGSNGLYSHDAETFEKKLGLSATNLSMVVNFSLSYLFDRYKKMFRQGDIIYLPLEYKNYSGPKYSSFGDIYDITIEKRFDNLTVLRYLRCFSAFDLNYTIESVLESIFAAGGIQKGVTVASLTPYGDIGDNTEENAARYSSYVKSLPSHTIEYSAPASGLTDFLSWAVDNGVIVIGGLPTTFDDYDIPEETIDSIKKLFVDHGGLFLITENRSLYPRHVFFDSPFHLKRDMQISHSTLLADEILKNWPDLLESVRKK